MIGADGFLVLPGVSSRQGRLNLSHCHWGLTPCDTAARFQITLDCACFQQARPVSSCARHLPSLITKISGRIDSHRGKTTLNVRPL